MTERKIDEAEARRIAERFLDETVRRELPEQDIITVDVDAFEHCWLVDWNSRAYVEDDDLGAALVGAGPVVVNRRTGAARFTVSGRPPWEQLDEE